MAKILGPPACSETREVFIGCGKTFSPGIHLCCIYNGEAERNRIIFQLLEGALQNGEKAAYFMDVIPMANAKEYRCPPGVDRLLERGQKCLSVASAKEIYYPRGTFVPDEMLERLSMFYMQSIVEGYTGARIIGEASWTVRGVPGSSRFMEYEARVNETLLKYPVNVICLYNAGLLDKAMLRDVLAVHPLTMVQGELMKNPHYEKSGWSRNGYLRSHEGQQHARTCRP